MSEKLIIKGKVDDSKHEGKISELKRIAEAENQLREWQYEDDSFVSLSLDTDSK